MSWVDDALPLPAARAVDADEALEAAMHALAALAAGIAAIHLMSAVVFREVVPALFFAGALAATGASAFVGEQSAMRRAAFLVGGVASAVVWLTVLPQAEGQSALVVLAMAGLSGALTRQWLDSTAAPIDAPLTSPRTDGAAWIEDDREEPLAATVGGD